MMLLGKLSFFLHILFLKNKEQPRGKKLQRINVSQVKQSPHTKIQLFLSTFKMAKKSRGGS